MATDTSTLPLDENKGPLVLGWIWATTILAIIAVILRLFTRLRTKSLGLDDYLILAATVVTIFGSSVNTAQVHYGFGRHIEYVLPHAESIAMWTYFAILQNPIVVGLAKLSVCWFVLRIIKGTDNFWIRAFLYTLMSVLAATIIVSELLFLLECFPLSKVWNTSKPGTCISQAVLTRFTEFLGVIGCVTDMACVAIPIFLFHKLNLNKRTKLSLMGLIVCGVVPAICGIGKAVTTQFASSDLTWDYVPVEIFSAVEANFGIFVACLPALRPLFQSFLHGTTLGSKSRSTGPPLTRKSDGQRKISRMFSSSQTSEFQTLNDHSDDHTFVPMGSIEVQHTLHVESESRKSVDDIVLERNRKTPFEEHEV